MKKLLRVLGGLVVLFVLAVGVFAAWAYSKTAEARAEVFDAHTVDFPVPFPLSEDELATLRAEKLAALPPVVEGEIPPDPLDGVDLGALALERAIVRGDHLVHGRYGCTVCHGPDLSGGTMVDSPVLGTWKGLNLTGGVGSAVVDFKVSDWERAVRHGVRPDGTALIMPSGDYKGMSDQELSDVIAYIKSRPKVDVEVPLPTYGPLAYVLFATGKLEFEANMLAGVTEHAVRPPDVGVTLEFGEHMSKICSGCHRADFSGGPIVGGDPSWVPAANLTPTNLKDWTFEDFDKVLMEGTLPTGAQVRMPMTEALKITAHMAEEERRALWTYLKSLPALPTGG